MRFIIRKLKRLHFAIRLHFASPYETPGVYQKFYGVKMGNNIRFTGRINFGTEPFLVELGNDVTLAEGVTFHTHDGGVWVFRKSHPGINIYAPIKVGNNVFIGAYTNILPGVSIGDNVVIGACSVVTKDLPPNGVYAGVPARYIRSLDDYKRKSLEKAIFLTGKGAFKQEILRGIANLKKKQE
jgi:Acetyltransferase (isoleucine patch superfamily)